MIKNFISIYNSLSNYFKKRSLLFILFLIVSTVLELLGIGMIIPFLEVLNSSNDSIFFDLELVKFFFPTNEREILFNILIIILIIYILKSLTLFYFYFWRNRFIWNVYKFISIKILNKFLRDNIEFYFKKNSNDLINTTYLESRSYVICFNEYLKIISDSFLLISITIFLLIYDFISTSIILILILISSCAIFFVYKKKLSFLGKVRLKASVSQLKNLQQIFFSIRDIKIKSSEDFFLKKYSSSIEEYSKTSYLANSILEVPKIFFELIFIFSISILMFFFISKAAVSNDEIITNIGVYSIAAFRIFPSITKIVHSFQQINFLKPSIEKVLPNLKSDELYSTKKINISDKINFNKRVSFKNVSYSYPGKKYRVIDNLSFEINKGDFIGIIGKSGIGKSTVLDLLMGLIKPHAGEIISDKTKIHLNINNWKKNIGYVSQSTTLLDDSIKNNIAFGIPENEIDISKVLKSAKNAQLLDFIESLDNKFETNVGERGVSLSGGQAQRIGIARELYREPSFLLLDEATSSLDSDTEKEFLSCLKTLNKNMTILFVSHKTTALSECNKIINLNHKID